MRRPRKGMSDFCGCTCLPNPGGNLAGVRLMPPPDSLRLIIYLLQFMCPWNDKARVRRTFHRDRSRLFRNSRWNKTWTLRRPKGCETAISAPSPNMIKWASYRGGRARRVPLWSPLISLTGFAPAAPSLVRYAEASRAASPRVHHIASDGMDGHVQRSVDPAELQSRHLASLFAKHSQVCFAAAVIIASQLANGSR
jgi:hypothetical protein